MQTIQARCWIFLRVCKSIMNHCSNLIINERQNILLELFNEFVLIISRSRKTTFELIDKNENILKMKSMSERYVLTLFRKKFENENNENDVRCRAKNRLITTRELQSAKLDTKIWVYLSTREVASSMLATSSHTKILTFARIKISKTLSLKILQSHSHNICF